MLFILKKTSKGQGYKMQAKFKAYVKHMLHQIYG
jgi:hypothetical protein